MTHATVQEIERVVRDQLESPRTCPTRCQFLGVCQNYRVCARGHVRAQSVPASQPQPKGDPQ